LSSFLLLLVLLVLLLKLNLALPSVEALRLRLTPFAESPPSYPILFLWFQQLSLVVAPQHQDFSFLSCLRAR
jgi:hypothetical protein